MANKLYLSLSPHDKGPMSTKKIMWAVVAALMPAFALSIYFFGISALVVTLTAVFSALVVEYLINRLLLKAPSSIGDGSAVITGLLLAFNVPSSIPLWQLVAGVIVAIGISKMAFGGLGNNPFNPALVGRAFMLASFPVSMTTWPKTIQQIAVDSAKGIDAITGATPLGLLKEGGLANIPHNLELLFGSVGGAMGEVSALAILLGGLFLLVRRVITWHIPVFYLLTLFVFTGIFWLINPATYASPVFHIFAGGAMLAAWFMATDMVTSPMTIKGQIIFASFAGLITGSIRLFGGYPEGASYSILIMNAFVPLIDKYIKPKRFGKES